MPSNMNRSISRETHATRQVASVRELQVHVFEVQLLQHLQVSARAEVFEPVVVGVLHVAHEDLDEQLVLLAHEADEVLVAAHFDDEAAVLEVLLVSSIYHDLGVDRVGLQTGDFALHHGVAAVDHLLDALSVVRYRVLESAVFVEVRWQSLVLLVGQAEGGVRVRGRHLAQELRSASSHERTTNLALSDRQPQDKIN